jgi:putative Ca2+/H+ antiporter (TMEM165/GDT1 family)
LFVVDQFKREGSFLTIVSASLSVLLTVVTAIFVAELTDKDALLLLSLATRMKARVVFTAGSVAFTITSALIVTAGYFLVRVVPVALISLAGGVIMIVYGTWSFFKSNVEEQELAGAERKLSLQPSRSLWSVFLSAVAFLIVLDLAGDATEVLTILFVARFHDTFLVFAGAVIALVAATAVETTLGNRLSKVLSLRRIRIFSLFVFLIIGSTAILTALFHI